MASSNHSNSNSDSDNYVFFWKPDRSNGEFGQWYRSGFTLNGRWYTTAEHFMMHTKALFFNDTDMANEIMRCRHDTPARHRRMGRSVSGFDQVKWTAASLQVTVLGNLCKFTQHADLEAVLLATGDKMLVEASPFDRIWGVGFSEAHALDNRDSWGQNKLGRALMIVRDLVKARKATYSTPFTDTSELKDPLYESIAINDFDITSMFDLMAGLNDHQSSSSSAHTNKEQKTEEKKKEEEEEEEKVEKMENKVEKTEKKVGKNKNKVEKNKNKVEKNKKKVEKDNKKNNNKKKP